MKAGPEFGTEQGKVFIVVCTLYGLKSACAAFWSFIAEKLDEIGLKSSVADPDVWLRSGKKEDSNEYYEYVVLYIDDILAISTDPLSVLKSLEGDTVKYKNNKIEPPKINLGAKLVKRQINGFDCWTITSANYVNAAVKTIKEALKEKKKWKMPTRANTPMMASFVPELDAWEKLNADNL